ncbi:signal peptidase I [Microbulbifer rhizosphaerae]|uniref:Signal peptidase I n=1 Tax=Microbulbifer rhizosphaerae TaxID=1562603 RepID=A0A7W4W862_9GAMM|nr:signal peptidase I [Microbulbifer rhizosphaerae]MBB3059492.1 signal peptidase I [Microbulbifer rhizosphaerae]
MKKLPIFLIGATGVIALTVYLINPFGTATLDPRARIWGIMYYHIPSASMMPTLNPGDYILVKTFAYANTMPEIGDIVVYKPPQLNVPFIGRVMARPGDNISVQDSIAIVNGQRQEENYILKPEGVCYIRDFPETTVPDEALFIVGDNRCNSRDSRMFGTVSQNNLIGKVSYIWDSSDKD